MTDKAFVFAIYVASSIIIIWNGNACYKAGMKAGRNEAIRAFSTLIRKTLTRKDLDVFRLKIKAPNVYMASESLTETELELMKEI